MVSSTVIDRVNSTVAQDGEIFAQTDLGNLDAGDEIRFLSSIKNTRKGSKDRIIVMSVISKLGDDLCYEHVEPVERFGLVGVYIVVSFGKDGGCCEARRILKV